METPITRAEHEEFRRRLEEENIRQDKRIELLEKNISHTQALASSVERLAVNMEHMIKEQENQGKRLETLEGRDGERWRTVVTHVITAIIGAVVCYLFTRIGM